MTYNNNCLTFAIAETGFLKLYLVYVINGM